MAVLDGMAVVGTFYAWDPIKRHSYVAVGHIVCGVTDDPDEMWFRKAVFYSEEHGQEIINLVRKERVSNVEFQAEGYCYLEGYNPFSRELYIPDDVILTARIRDVSDPDLQGWTT